MKPIHKFNSGMGATLCNVCSRIITTGMTDALYCDKHKNITTDELREIINKLDNRPNGGINYIALFSDHSGFIYENTYGTRLGEFNNQEEMIDLINKLLNE